MDSVIRVCIVLEVRRGGITCAAPGQGRLVLLPSLKRQVSYCLSEGPSLMYAFMSKGHG